MKFIVARSTLPILLISLALLLTACDQGIAAVPTAQAIDMQAVNTQTGGDQATATAPVANTDVPTVAVGEEATATIDVGQAGSADLNSAGLDLTSVDPCKLLAQDDVKRVMGDVPYKPRLMTQEAYHASCSYVEPTLEVNSPRLFLSLDPIELWDMHPADAQTVGSTGDAAYTVEYNGWRTLSVLLKNKVVVQMDIYPPATEMARQLTLKVIERLP